MRVEYFVFTFPNSNVNNDDGTQPDTRKTLVYCHGNSETLPLFLQYLITQCTMTPSSSSSSSTTSALPSSALPTSKQLKKDPKLILNWVKPNHCDANEFGKHIKQIICVEYPGYGASGIVNSNRKNPKTNNASLIIPQKTPTTEFQLKQWYPQMVNAVLQHHSLTWSDVCLIGFSIGTGPASWMAAHFPVQKLVLVAPFTSIRAVAKHHNPFLSGFVMNRFQTDKLLAIAPTTTTSSTSSNANSVSTSSSIKCPIVIVHGTADTTIPYYHAATLHDIAIKAGHQCQLVTLPNVDHINIPLSSVFNAAIS
jgi:hypothetical protein